MDNEGTDLDVVIQRRRNTKAAGRLLSKLLKNPGARPTKIVTDRLGSYGAALKLLGLKHLQDVGGRKNNRAEYSPVNGGVKVGHCSGGIKLSRAV